MDEEIALNADPLLLIHSRNDFYRQKYKLILSVFLFALIAIGILTGMLIYLIKHPPKPYYFPADDISRLIKDTPIQQPNMTTQDVSDWMVKAVEEAYSYDFVNYRSQLQSAQKYFAEYGWQNYMKGLQASNNLVALTKRKLVIVAKVVAAPTVMTQGILGNAYAWKFQMPMIVSYYQPPYTEKSKFNNSLLVTVIVQRQNILTSNRGLGIVQMNSNLVITAPTQNLEAPPELE